MAKSSYIVGAKRSPIGRFLGGLSRLSAAQIGAQVAKALLDELKVDRALIDDVQIGMVLQAGAGQNPARQVALAAGCPPTVSCCTVNKVCGSGLQSAMYADTAIRAGDLDVVLAGGIESMSQAPFLVREMRAGQKYGSVKMIDSLEYDGLINVFDNDIMGALGDETAKKCGVTRAQQDEFAAGSQQRAAAAISNGWFADEIVPIEPRPGKTPITTDECVRPDTTADALGMLKAVFSEGGTVTAGNASQLADGAAMTLIASEAGLKKLNAKPLARIVAHVTTGRDPRDVFLTPIDANRLVCDRAGWAMGDVDLWEVNEAFAAEMVAVCGALELDPERVNVHGGSIALGHPLGASGARVLTTLVHAMKRRGAKRGVVSMCLGGGNAVAMAIEMM